jgi:NAD(P)-dependent dehydrogenase (short-subunit alcohol dehydrogenase family)
VDREGGQESLAGCEEQFDATFSVNVRGTFFTVQKA